MDLIDRDAMLTQMHDTMHAMMAEVIEARDESAMLVAIVTPRAGQLQSFEAMFFADERPELRSKLIEALERLVQQLRGH